MTLDVISAASVTVSTGGKTPDRWALDLRDQSQKQIYVVT